MRTIVLRYPNGARTERGDPIAGARLTYGCDDAGRGLYRRARDGRWIAYLAPEETPAFGSPRALRAFVRRALGVRQARLVSSSGWPVEGPTHASIAPAPVAP